VQYVSTEYGWKLQYCAKKMTTNSKVRIIKTYCWVFNINHKKEGKGAGDTAQW
jgi:hypothetical protein